ncbi:MAG TPA: hypothetical protein VHE59_21085 [Mucilaginibacter sp.]|nr:hypothetical protein [Mucilaginibacter sp.]
MKKACYLLFCCFLLNCNNHERTNHYILTLNYYYIDVSKEKGAVIGQRIDTEKIQAPNDTVAYKHALAGYYVALRFDTIPGSTEKVRFFTIKDNKNINLESKLSKNVKDSLTLLVRMRVASGAESSDLIPDSIMPQDKEQNSPLMKKIKALDSTGKATDEKKVDRYKGRDSIRKLIDSLAHLN